jgi:hypothetical protein
MKHRKYLKVIYIEEKETWSWVPDGGLIPGQTDRVTIGGKITVKKAEETQ